MVDFGLTSQTSTIMQQDYGSVPQIDESNGLAGISDNKSSNELHRHLTLFDLVCVGVGATGELVLDI